MAGWLCVFRAEDGVLVSEEFKEVPATVLSDLVEGMSNEAVSEGTAYESAELLILQAIDGGLVIARIQGDDSIAWESPDGVRYWQLPDELAARVDALRDVQEELQR